VAGLSLDILPVKQEAKLSASEVPGEVVGSGEEDLRCRSLLTVCQRRLGLLTVALHMGVISDPTVDNATISPVLNNIVPNGSITL